MSLLAAKASDEEAQANFRLHADGGVYPAAGEANVGQATETAAHMFSHDEGVFA